MTRRYLYFEDLSDSRRANRGGNSTLQRAQIKHNAYEQRLPNVTMLSRGEFSTREMQTQFPISSWNNILVPRMGGADSQEGQIYRFR